MAAPRFNWTIQALSLITLCVIAQGCTAVKNGSESDFAAEPMETSAMPGYAVRMEFNVGQPKIHRGHLTSPMTIQDVLEECGAIRKYRNMQIDILRKIPESGRTIKMAVDYDAGKKSVMVEQNYAIHNGDRISIKPMDSSPLDQLLKNALIQGN